MLFAFILANAPIYRIFAGELATERRPNDHCNCDADGRR